MKKMTRYIILFCCTMLLACSDSVMNKIDKNPNVFSDAPLNTLLPQVLTRYTVEIAGGSTARTAQFLSEQTTYNLGESVLNGLSGKGEAGWNSGYLLLNDLAIIKEKAAKSNAWLYAGIAEVIEALVLSNLTDLYGDIPYTEALKPDVANPHFDSAQTIYVEIQKVLDLAIADLEKDPGTIVPKTDDMIFAGDKTLWIKTAYGIKARLYNRLSKTDPKGSAEKSLAAIAKSFVNENEKFAFSKFQNTLNNGNPFSISQNSQPMSSVGNGIFNAMKRASPTGKVDDDPRANIWFTRIKGELIAAPNGTARADFQEPRLDGAFYSKPEIFKYFGAPQPMLTFIELKFIEAEARLRLSDAAGAHAAYLTAVRSALKEASLFNSAKAIEADKIEKYMALPLVALSPVTLDEKSVITQKYIYFFQYQPVEAFNDFRRTGLFTVTDPGGSPTRFPYPVSELTRNRNTPAKIDDFTVFGEATKLFWVK